MKTSSTYVRLGLKVEVYQFNTKNVYIVDENTSRCSIFSVALEDLCQVKEN